MGYRGWWFLLLFLAGGAHGVESESESASASASSIEKKGQAVKKKSKSDKIKVLGSRIKKIDMEGPKSIMVLDQDDLRRTGASTLNEALNTLTVASFGSFKYGSGYGSGEGVQSMSIHGLGSSNTLVLLNGKRLSKDPYLQITDISVIPMAAVEKVTILKGTASAVYGSDALGGVVDIRTKEDFAGFGFGGEYSKARSKGGDTSNFFAVSGVSTSKYRNLTVVNYKKQDSILVKDRPWVDSSERSTFGAVPSYRAADGKFQPVRDCGGSIKTVRTGDFCEYSYWDDYIYQGERDDLSFINDFEYNLSSRTTLNARLFASKVHTVRTSTKNAIDPSDGYGVKASVIEGKNLDLASAPYVNKNGEVEIKGRLIEDGGSYTENDNLTLSGAFSLVHEINDSATLEFSVSESRVSMDTFWSDRYNDVLLKRAIREGEFDLTAEGDRGDLSLYRTDAPMFNKGYSRVYDVALTGDNDFFGYAAGVSFMNEGYRTEVADQTASNSVKNLGGGGGEGERDVSAVYAEFNIPFFDRMVELDLAARFDEYSDFGSTLNPQVGLVFRPRSDILIKTRYGTGFKAPSLDDVNGEEARYYTGYKDYLNCNKARASGKREDIETYCDGDLTAETLGGGNKGLQPEKSTMYSVFLGYEPLSNLGFNIEYWNTTIVDEISTPDTEEIMRLEADGKSLPDGVSIERDADGDVVRIIKPTSNLSSTLASGIDTKAYWGKKYGFGNVGVTSTYSYYLSLKTRNLETSPLEEDLADKPRWRWNNEFTYGLGNNALSLKSLSHGGFEKQDPESGNVGSFTQWDFNWKYNYSSQGSVDIGGRNIFNQGYPLDNTAGATQGALDGPIATVVGPTYYLRFTQVL